MKLQMNFSENDIPTTEMIRKAYRAAETKTG